MEVSNLFYSLKSKVADFRILSICGIILRPQVGEVVPVEILVLVTLFLVLSLKYVVNGLLIPLSIEWKMVWIRQ